MIADAPAAISNMTATKTGDTLDWRDSAAGPAGAVSAAAWGAAAVVRVSAGAREGAACCVATAGAAPAGGAPAGGTTAVRKVAASEVTPADRIPIGRVASIV